MYPCMFVCRLSKELQQKDKVIESLQAELNQRQPRSDTPCSSHALSDTTDQSDRISFVSDDQGSTNEELELCSDIDAASEYGPEDRRASPGASTGAVNNRHTHTHTDTRMTAHPYFGMYAQ
jgi:myomegalin